MNSKFKHLESSSEYRYLKIHLEYQTHKNVALMYLSLSLQVIIISTLTSVENLLGICAGMVRKLSSLITLYAYIIDGQCIYVIIKSY